MTSQPNNVPQTPGHPTAPQTPGDRGKPIIPPTQTTTAAYFNRHRPRISPPASKCCLPPAPLPHPLSAPILLLPIVPKRDVPAGHPTSPASKKRAGVLLALSGPRRPHCVACATASLPLRPSSQRRTSAEAHAASRGESACHHRRKSVRKKPYRPRSRPNKRQLAARCKRPPSIPPVPLSLIISSLSKLYILSPNSSIPPPPLPRNLHRSNFQRRSRRPASETRGAECHQPRQASPHSRSGNKLEPRIPPKQAHVPQRQPRQKHGI
ncbi:hypothetical protein LZ30DRAFT_730871 [Colletotrichum cereale]|nr:hypothetical protein LZ30DRAFT_730871 [Colletotrichum cereale]